RTIKRFGALRALGQDRGTDTEEDQRKFIPSCLIDQSLILAIQFAFASFLHHCRSIALFKYRRQTANSTLDICQQRAPCSSQYPEDRRRASSLGRCCFRRALRDCGKPLRIPSDVEPVVPTKIRQHHVRDKPRHISVEPLDPVLKSV